MAGSVVSCQFIDHTKSGKDIYNLVNGRPAQKNGIIGILESEPA